jgi:hypothetical protein
MQRSLALGKAAAKSTRPFQDSLLRAYSGIINFLEKCDPKPPRNQAFSLLRKFPPPTPLNGSIVRVAVRVFTGSSVHLISMLTVEPPTAARVPLKLNWGFPAYAQA